MRATSSSRNISGRSSTSPQRWLSNKQIYCWAFLFVISIADCKTDTILPLDPHSNAEFESYQSEVVSNLSQLKAPGGSASGGDSSNKSTSELMVHEREFVSPQLRIQIDCQRDKTIVRVNFTRPFSGTLGAGKLDTTSCKLNGNGTTRYELEVAHNATQCDIQWDSESSSISNTLFIRYHQSLETGNDLAKNIACRLTVGDLVVGRRPVKAERKKIKKTTSPSS